MANDMNSVLLDGTAVGSATAYPTGQRNLAEATFVIHVYRDGWKCPVKIRCHGRLAETVVEQVQVGTRLRVIGYLDVNVDGKEAWLEVVAQTVNYLRKPR